MTETRRQRYIWRQTRTAGGSLMGDFHVIDRGVWSYACADETDARLICALLNIADAAGIDVETAERIAAEGDGAAARRLLEEDSAFSVDLSELANPVEAAQEIIRHLAELQRKETP